MKPTRRRRLTAAVAIAASAALLSACGSGTPGVSASDDGGDSGNKTVVQFWHQVFTTPENAWYKQVVKDFNESQDEITVKETVVPGDAWDQKMKAAQAAKTAPDVYANPGRLNDGVRQGIYKDLDGLIPDDDFAKITDAAKSIATVDGKWYAYPLLLEPQRMLYWNKDIFKKAGLDVDNPPTSWDELMDTCAKIKPVLDKGQFCIETFSDEGTLAWGTVADQMHVAGHLPISDDWSKADATDPAYQKIIDYYKELHDKGYIPKESLAAGNSAAPFGEGKVAMITQGSWGMSELASDYPDVFKVTGLAPTVTSDGDQTKALTTVGNYKWVIDANSQNAEAAAKFIQFALAGDTAELVPFFVNTQFSKAPARSDVADAVKEDPKAADAPWVKTINEDVVPYTIPEPLYPWDISLAMGTAIQKGMLGQASPADALKSANTTIQKVIKQNNLPEVRKNLGDQGE